MILNGKKVALILVYTFHFSMLFESYSLRRLRCRWAQRILWERKLILNHGKWHCVCVWGLYIQMRMPAADFYHIQEGKGNRIPTMSKEKEVALRWKSVAREDLLLLTGLSVQYRATSHPHWNQTLLLKFKPWLNFSSPLKWFTVGKETRFYLIATKSVNSVDYSRVACLW